MPIMARGGYFIINNIGKFIFWSPHARLARYSRANHYMPFLIFVSSNYTLRKNKTAKCDGNQKEQVFLQLHFSLKVLYKLNINILLDIFFFFSTILM